MTDHTHIGGRFEGVAKIVRFNPRFYVASALGFVSAVLLLTLLRLPVWLRTLAGLGTALLLFWTLSCLFVSWFVYDHAAVTRWAWLRSSLAPLPSRWANIHAGLDESTAFLRQLLPGTDGVVIDIFDPATMTEPSIARARQISPATQPFLVGSAAALPLPDGNRDAIFLLFAAHELRDPKGRTSLLREAHRILAPNGRILLVEHLRDLPNLVAFGPGFLHFHSRDAWLRSIVDADLQVIAHRTITPFVHCFTLAKVSA